tara:strand:+ start:2328 stop:2675 length:348 start_codon:yes stop_codon:yes gene_type:complete
MLDIGGKIFKFDLDALEKIIRVNNPDTFEEFQEKITTDSNDKLVTKEIIKTKSPRSREIDATKYESIRGFMEVVLVYNEEVDSTLGLARALDSAPLPFKMAFNTLLDYGIIVEIE